MLTALSDEENQLRGFEQQIDDYIPKPFSPKILLCKIAAILRRRTAENQNQFLLTYKELSMDVDGFHVYQGRNEVVLTSKEFALLRLMLENRERSLLGKCCLTDCGRTIWRSRNGSLTVT